MNCSFCFEQRMKNKRIKIQPHTHTHTRTRARLHSSNTKTVASIIFNLLLEEKESAIEQKREKSQLDAVFEFEIDKFVLFHRPGSCTRSNERKTNLYIPCYSNTEIVLTHSNDKYRQQRKIISTIFK